MKTISKIFVIMTIVVISLEKIVYGANPEFKVIDEEGQIKELEDGQGYISKSVVDKNLEQSEVIIELKVSNITKKQKNEIVFLVDNSSSMTGTIDSSKITKKQVVSNEMQTLVNKIYDQSPNVYMGAVKFSGTPNTICNITNQKQTMLNAVDNFRSSTVGSSTNIAKGLTAANSLFSKDCENKILVLLTDGLSDANSTIAALKDVDASGTFLISMVTGVDNAKVSSIFGTEQNPTVGKLYNIPNANISEVIANNIYEDIMERIPNAMNNVTITDYFPEDIVNNFEFSYVQEPNLGNISATIEDDSIVWNISKIQPEEEATVRYSLKLKDNYDKNIINKIIPTNERVDVYYTDYKNNAYELNLDKSPKVELVLIEEAWIQGSSSSQQIEQDEQTVLVTSTSKAEKETIKNTDSTTSNKILPRTGNKKGIVLILLGMLIAVYGFYARMKNTKKDIKTIIIK